MCLIVSIFFLLLDAALLWAWHAYSVFGFFLYPSIHVSMSRAGGVPINIDIQFGLFYINESDTIYFLFLNAAFVWAWKAYSVFDAFVKPFIQVSISPATHLFMLTLG